MERKYPNNIDGGDASDRREGSVTAPKEGHLHKRP